METLFLGFLLLSVGSSWLVEKKKQQRENGNGARNFIYLFLKQNLGCQWVLFILFGFPREKQLLKRTK